MKNFTLRNTVLATLTAIFVCSASLSTLHAQATKASLLSYHPESAQYATHTQDFGLVLENYSLFREQLITSIGEQFHLLKTGIGKLILSPAYFIPEKEAASSEPLNLENWMEDLSSWESSTEILANDEVILLEPWMNIPFELSNGEQVREEEPALESWMMNAQGWIEVASR